MKKTSGDIINSHKCTINDNHIMYDSWDMNCNRQNFFHFVWDILYPFTLLTTQKIKILKKNKQKKNTWRYHHFTQIYQKSWSYAILIICYATTKLSWDMVHNRCNCYFSFWAIFCPFASLTIWKLKILKKLKKNHGSIILQ